MSQPASQPVCIVQLIDSMHDMLCGSAGGGEAGGADSPVPGQLPEPHTSYYSGAPTSLLGPQVSTVPPCNRDSSSSNIALLHAQHAYAHTAAAAAAAAAASYVCL